MLFYHIYTHTHTHNKFCCSYLWHNCKEKPKQHPNKTSLLYHILQYILIIIITIIYWLCFAFFSFYGTRWCFFLYCTLPKRAGWESGLKKTEIAVEVSDRNSGHRKRRGNEKTLKKEIDGCTGNKKKQKNLRRIQPTHAHAQTHTQEQIPKLCLCIYCQTQNVDSMS